MQRVTCTLFLKLQQHFCNWLGKILLEFRFYNVALFKYLNFLIVLILFSHHLGPHHWEARHLLPHLHQRCQNRCHFHSHLRKRSLKKSRCLCNHHHLHSLLLHYLWIWTTFLFFLCLLLSFRNHFFKTLLFLIIFI